MLSKILETSMALAFIDIEMSLTLKRTKIIVAMHYKGYAVSIVLQLSGEGDYITQVYFYYASYYIKHA